MTDQISALPPTTNRAANTAWQHVSPDAPEELPSYTSGEDLSFEDVLKALNPLHHLPVISTIYQAISGERLPVGPRVMGAAILGGPVGLLIAGVTSFIEEMSGGTVADHAVALFNDVTGDGESEPAEVLAAAPKSGAGKAPGADESARDEMPGEASQVGTTQNDRKSIGQDLSAMAPALLGAIPGAGFRSEQASLIPARNVSTDSESKRIAQSLLLAQRAQASLLFASVRANEAVRNRPSSEGNRHGDDNERPHTNLRPKGVGAVWYADAMQRALDKYRAEATGARGAD